MIFECLYVINSNTPHLNVHSDMKVNVTAVKVGTATRLRDEWSGVPDSSSSRDNRYFFFSNTSRPVLGPHSFLFNSNRVSFLGIKRPERCVNQLPPSSAQVKNDWSYISAPLCVYMASIGTNSHILSALAKLWKATISFVVSVRQTAWNNSAHTRRILTYLLTYSTEHNPPSERISTKFGTAVFFENLSREFKFH
jgi:hypothetical protein